MICVMITMISISCSTDVYLMVDMFWIYVRVCFIFDSYLLQSPAPHLIFMFYHLVLHIVVEASSCFSHSSLIIFSRTSNLFLIVIRYIVVDTVLYPYALPIDYLLYCQRCKQWTLFIFSFFFIFIFLLIYLVFFYF